ncbi:low molecular mass lipoprotein PBMHPC-23-like [Battus philenor]|uniref:low molecular mass lipoprotein PBMHPC-23-like n=1 Tax=Battus philenor TaxID=42288 RepID=UPI0035CF15B2
MFGSYRKNSRWCKELFEEEAAEEEELLSAVPLSMGAWRSAPSPNYDRNENLLYPYSELDYVAEFPLVQLPAPHRLIDHVDYWGEGRVVTEKGISGFSNCYNVNEKHKLVSGGSDVDRKIPNRIPVFSSMDCDTSHYLKDSSVKLVTVSRGRISRRCARDIARMVVRNIGAVVAFGYDDDSEDIKNLEKALKVKQLLHCPKRRLPPALRELTAFNTYRMYVHAEYLEEELQRNITERNFKEALAISKVFKTNNYLSTIHNVVFKLLEEGSEGGNGSVMYYAYYLWSNKEQDIVKKQFPEQFAPILNGDRVSIFHNKYNLRMKLNNNNLCEVSTESLVPSNKINTWKFSPIWQNNNLSFKLQSVDEKLYLTLDNNKIYGVREVFGCKPSNDLKFQWTLVPILQNNEVFFYVVNKQFMHGLAMDSEIKEGYRRVIAVDGAISEPDKFSWKIQPLIESYSIEQ